MSGGGLTEHDARGHPVRDEDLLLLLNAHHDEIPFTLPGEPQERWVAQVDTSAEDGTPPRLSYEARSRYPLQGRSVALLRHRRA
jgi:glycogen operon protein